MRNPAIILLSLCLLTIVAQAQKITSKNQLVLDSAGSRLAGNATEEIASDLPFFSSSADAEKIVSSIMNALGMDANFKIKVADVPNVEATIRHHKRYILYNPDFVNQVNAVTKNKWASIFILAHEVGHHLEGHTLIDAKSRPDIELQADQFAGYVLCKMGASLQQAQLAMHYISNLQGSKTHPGRADRLMAIETGWDKAEKQSGQSMLASNNTPENAEGTN